MLAYEDKTKKRNRVTIRIHSHRMSTVFGIEIISICEGNREKKTEKARTIQTAEGHIGDRKRRAVVRCPRDVGG